MASTPRDRFDDIPADLVRVGAHRGPAKRGRGWIRFAWFALATGLLIIGGLYGLSRVNPAISFELPVIAGGEGGGPTVSASPEPVVEPVTDPNLVDPALNLTISVLNGSPTDGLQNDARLQIKAAGWPDPAAQNAGDRTQEVTVIYYHTADFEGIAKGLAQLLGIDPANIRLSDFYLGAPITIVLGADYVPAA